MRRCTILLLLLVSSAAAQPTPSCPGDCNLDGEVRIDELLQGVNFLLLGAPPDGCDELDDDRDGQVAVNEMVLAVGNALGACRLTGDDAAEAGAAAAVGVVDAFQVIDLGSAAAGAAGSGGAGAVGGRRFVGAAGDAGRAGGQVPPCPDGGALEESCSSDATSSRLTVTYSRCRTVSQRLELTVDGRVERTVDDGLYCSTRQIADGADVSEQLTGFRQTITDRENGAVLFDFEGTFTRELRPGRDSCAGRDGAEILDGMLALRCDAGAESTVCPAEGRDLSLTARRLTVIREARGETTCLRGRTLLGRLESRDRISGQAFDAVYRQFVIDDQLGAPPVPIRLNGAIALDCLGEINVLTEIPLQRAGNARCPGAGLLFVRLPDGAESGVRYSPDGLQLDLDGDGRPERTAASCEDRSLSRCR